MSNWMEVRAVISLLFGGRCWGKRDDGTGGYIREKVLLYLVTDGWGHYDWLSCCCWSQCLHAS